MGVLSFIYATTVSGLEPMPAWVPGRLFWAYLTGVVLIAAGICVVAGKWAHPAAIILGIMLLLWVLLLQAPGLIAHPSDGGAWTTTFETLALCGAAWILVGRLATKHGLRRGLDHAAVSFAAAGRICFGVSMLVFGALHYIYADYVGTLVPAWIPGGSFWSYLTAAAFVAAGVSIITKVKMRLAATLLGVMFGSWVLILHAPRVAAKLHNREEWTSLFVALAMCGGAWLLAGNSAQE